MDERWLSFLYYFNVETDYFECHEYGESLWLDTGRPEPLKGMIQAAVCLYHLFNGNVRGGYSMWLRGRRYLQPALPEYLGVDVADLVQQIDNVFQGVPADWREQFVAAGEVKALGLPAVKVKILDGRLRGQFDKWLSAKEQGK